MRRAVLVSALVLALPLLMGCEPGERREHQERTQQEQPAHRVTVAQLQSDYENPAHGDSLYKDKVITVTGQVRSIGEAFGSYTVRLGDAFAGVTCYFDGEAGREEVAGIRTGQTVSIRGVCRGKSLGTVMLRGCRLD